MIPQIFQYDFMIRGMVAGIIIAFIAPLIGIFLVLRRYSLIADTLSHVSLAGVAVGLLTGIHPLITAITAAIGSSVAIERLRGSRRVYGETALSLFLSGSLAVAVVLISLAHGFNVNLFSYLFGSIVTVKTSDIIIISFLGATVAFLISIYFRDLTFISFDEEAAQASGIPTKLVNMMFMVLSATAIALSIPIVGVLLISALIVIPVVTSLQLRLSFQKTLLAAEFFSIASVIIGIITSFYVNISSGGTIVLTALSFFCIVFLFKGQRH